MKKALVCLALLILASVGLVLQDTGAAKESVATPVEAAEVRAAAKQVVAVTTSAVASGALEADDAVDLSQQQAATLNSVANGDITIDQGTRDPAEALDAGAKAIIPILGTLLASVVSLALGALVRASPDHKIPNLAEAFVRHSITGGGYVLAGLALRNVYGQLPHSLLIWLGMGLTGSAGAGAGRSGIELWNWVKALRFRKQTAETAPEL